MAKIRSVDYEILRELLKNCRRSDRELAKSLGVSQPTITRRRATIEKELIDGYTAIPKWEKIGFELIAFNFVKGKVKYAKPEVRKEGLRRVEEWMMNHPNVIFAIDGQGMGWDGVCISFHKSYSDYMEFIRQHDSELSDLLIERESFVADINQTTIKKPFHLKYLAKMTW
jgi:DNA-binding Lrp family transcriptional regulator